MKEISDTDVGRAFNGSPFRNNKNLEELARQYKAGKKFVWLAVYWDVTVPTIVYRLVKLGLYKPTKKWYN